MRTEEEMLNLILNFAKEDERIRVVGLEGSRANPNAEKDSFQDFDISYLVSNMDSFMQDYSWVDVFGKRMLMQMPEAMSLYKPTLDGWFSYLMLFEDGNRVDVTLVPIDEKDKYIEGNDGLLKILLDKDNIVGQLPAATDKFYHVEKPSKEFYQDCCNEFWWVSTYVAKGLWRKEIIFAIDHINSNIRPCLLQMMEWKVGVETDYSVSVGKCNKYLDKYVEEDVWDRLIESYNNGSYESCWESLYLMGELFKETAVAVGASLGYIYPQRDNDNVIQYLNKVHLDSFKS